MCFAKYLMTLKILIILSVFQSPTLYADVTPKVLSPETQELQLQNRILKESLEIQTKSIEKFDSIYMWALGFAASFLIAFLGVNIYFLHAKSKDDYDRLSELVNNKTNEIQSNLELSFNKKINEYNDKIYELNIKTKETLRTEAIALIKNNLKQINENHKSLKYDVLNIQIDLLKINGPKTTLMTEYFNFIEFLIGNNKDGGYDWKISICLDEIYAILIAGAKIDSIEKSEVSRLLLKLPTHFNEIVSRIRNNL